MKIGKRVNRIGKRLLGAILALFMSLPFAAVNTAPTRVLADPFAIKVHPLTNAGTTDNTRLIQGSQNSIPQLNRGEGDGEVMVSWPLVTSGGSTALGGVYELTYQINANKVVRVTTELNPDGSMTVSYEESASRAPFTPTMVYSGFSVFVNGMGFVPLAQVPSDPNRVVTLGAVYGEPVFNITPGSPANGFSFRVNNYTIHFRWENGTFYYSANGFDKGYLYDFNLAYESGATAHITTADITDTAYAFLGYNSAQIISTPFSSEDNGDAYGVNHVFDWTGGAAMEFPADTEDWIYLTIPLPQVWDNSVKRNANAVDMPSLSVTVSMTDTTAAKAAYNRTMNNVKVFGAGGLTAAWTDIGAANYHYTSSAVGTVQARLVGGNIEFRYKNLADGILYDLSYINVTDTSLGTSHYQTKRTDLPGDKIYTLLSYNWDYINGKYYLVVKPYEGFSGTYSLLDGGGTALYKVTVKKEDSTNFIYIPLDSNMIKTASTFRIGYTYDKDMSILSQWVDFMASDNTVDFYTPGDFHVEDGETWGGYAERDTVVLTPIKGADKDTQNLTYAMSWNVISYADLLKMLNSSAANTAYGVKVMYDLNRVLTPIDKNESFTYGTAEVSFRFSDPVLYPDQIVADFVVKDNAGNIVYTATDQDIFNDGRYSTTPAAPDKGIVRAYVEFSATAYKKGAPNHDPRPWFEFEYPNVYFLNVKPTDYWREALSATDTAAWKPFDPEKSDSLYDSLTLNDLSGLEVPPPQNVQALNPELEGPNFEKPTRSSFDVRFTMPLDKIKEFIDSNLPYDSYDLTYNIYISQSEEKIKAIQTMENYADRLAASKTVTFNNSWLTITPPATNPYIYFGAVMTGGGSPVYVTDSTNPAIVNLRQNDVVRLSDMRLFIDNSDLLAAIAAGSPLPITWTLDGLDKNQKYYVCVDISIDLIDTPAAPAPVEEEWLHSKVSNLDGLTTKTDLIKPNPGEKTPPAPFPINKENVGLSYATIFWNRVKDVIPPGVDPADYGTLEYEIIRLTDNEMPVGMLDSRTDFDTVYNRFLAGFDKIGLRTDGAAEVLGEYDGKALKPISSSDTRYKWNGLPGNQPDILRLTDNTLKPNTLYFYYVRTVRVINGNELYSTWSVVSVTTTPVEAPINLIVARDTTVVYDPMHAFVIEFDAPIADIAALGADFALQYQLKREADDWGSPVTMSAATLKASAKPITINGKQYYHFTYTITGLKYGTHYSIQVRMQDLRYNDFSMWSNLADTRTEIDSEEAEKDKKTDDWLDYLKSKIEELFKNDYWVLADGSQFLYRPGMYDGVMLKNPGSGVNLVSATAARSEYLIPASALEKMNAQNKGFFINYAGVEFTISPKAIADASSAVRSARDRIGAKAAADYYLRIVITTTAYNVTIEGNTPVTPQYDVSLAIVTGRNTAKAVDEDIRQGAIKQLSSDTAFSSASAVIRQMIEANSKPDDIILYVNNFINANLRSFYPMAARIYNAQADMSYSIATLETPLYIKYTPEDSTAQANGYKREAASWTKQQLSQTGLSFAIVTKTTGSYIFTGFSLSLPGIENLPDSGDLSRIYTKYGLGDFLGKNDNFHIDGALTAYQTAGIAARLMGAGAADDPFTYLKGKGYSVTARKNNQAATQQEAVLEIMAVYEVKLKTKISNVKITNYNSTANLVIDSRYLPYVRAANELKIFDAKGMKPTGGITTKQVLEMITALSRRVKL